MSIYDKASLVLIPSGTKTSKVYSQKPVNGDGDFTFSRSTAATRVNADGNIEKETQNLLLQSNQFDSGVWSNDDTTETGGQSGYDGTSNAWKVVGNTNASRHYIVQSISKSGVNTWSLYAKASGHSYVQFGSGSTTNQYVNFDLSDGSIGNIGSDFFSAIAEDIGGGWYRLSVVDKISTNGFYISLVSSKTAGWLESWSMSNATDGIYIQDAQLEQGLVARDYIETTTAAVEGGITDNVPRLDYTDSSCPALLLEPQRTNKESNSELLGTFSNSIIRLVNDTTSPEGLVNANKIVEASATARHEIYSDPISFGGNDHIVSFFGKADERRYVSVFLAGDPAYGGATFDLQAGTISQTSGGTTANVEDYGNGWYRCSFSVNYPSSTQLYICMRTADNDVNVQTYAGDGTSGFHIWGMQIEQGSYATSYIPTYGTSVTRNQDVNNAYNVSSLIGQTEGTLYLEFVVGQTSDFQVIFQTRTTNTTTSNVGQIDIRFQNGTIRALGNDGGATQFNINGGAISLGDVVKCAVAYANNNSTFYINGNQAATDTNCSFTSSVLDDITFNERAAVSTSYIQKQFIKQTLIFKTRLSNEELAALTTI